MWTMNTILLFSLYLTCCGAFSVSRRHFVSSAAAAVPAVLLTTTAAPPPPAFAAAASQEATDKEKIVKGYQRLTYLLEHWEEETTICGRSDNPYIGCERTPLKVMEYLGYRNVNDPLFKVEKTLMRLQDSVPAGKDEKFQEAMDKVVEKADEGSGLAYVSSWGESNPGGGKDRIELFIERSKNDVIDVQQSLETVMNILDLKKP